MRQKFAKLVKDDTPMVRWGAAQAMAVICHALDQEMITEFPADDDQDLRERAGEE